MCFNVLLHAAWVQCLPVLTVCKGPKLLLNFTGLQADKHAKNDNDGCL